jgi:Transposase IS66 family
VLFAKYGLHLALNRQSDVYEREGIDLDVSTLADWVGAAAATLMPLVDVIRAHVFAAERIHADDTTVPVLAKGKTRRAMSSTRSSGRNRRVLSLRNMPRRWARPRTARPWNIDVHSHNHRRMNTPYRATLPVRSKRGAHRIEDYNEVHPHSGDQVFRTVHLPK